MAFKQIRVKWKEEKRKYYTQKKKGIQNIYLAFHQSFRTLPLFIHIYMYVVDPDPDPDPDPPYMSFLSFLGRGINTHFSSTLHDTDNH